MLSIKVPNKKFLKEKLTEVKLIKKEMDLLWEKCENDELDCDEVFEKTKEMENDAINSYLSMFLMVPKIDEVIKRKEDESFSVSEIFISKEDEAKFKEYDKKILEILYSKDWTEKKINRDLSWLYLMHGFSTAKDVKPGTILLGDNILTKKEE